MTEQEAIKRLKVKQSAYEYQSNIDEAFNMAIKALEKQIAKTGDYIIRGVNGEIYPCKPDIFEKTYECVDEVIE